VTESRRFRQNKMGDLENERGGFFTGLSNKHATRPGFTMVNEDFILKFESIQCEDLETEEQRRFVIDRFQSCYRWNDIMDIILECLEYYYDAEDFEIDLQHCVSAFLCEYSGWGLLFTLLPQDFQKFLLVLFSHINIKNHQENIVKSNDELYHDLLAAYENETQGLPLSQLVPKIDIRMLNVIGGPKEHERRKVLRMKFNSSRFKLIAIFGVEKIRNRRTLVEHAAEVVARMVDDTEDLEIPETLKPLVNEKLVDSEWVVSYWCAKFRHEMTPKNQDTIEESDDNQIVDVAPIVPQRPSFFYLVTKLIILSPWLIFRAVGTLGTLVSRIWSVFRRS